MKTIAVLSLCASASAFAPLPLHAARNSALNAESVEGPGKINGLIDLDSPKVVNNEVRLQDKYKQSVLNGDA